MLWKRVLKGVVIVTSVACILSFTSTASAKAEGLDSKGKVAVVKSLDGSETSVTEDEFVKGLDELVLQGRLKVISVNDGTYSKKTVYGVVNPENHKIIMTFVADIPKHKDRIGGAMWGWEPSLTFDQEDQSRIIVGGGAAVTAMATVAAAVLSETVVGSILSAGVIAFVGGIATDYLSKHGTCPSDKPTLWVSVITGSVACR